MSEEFHVPTLKEGAQTGVAAALATGIAVAGGMVVYGACLGVYEGIKRLSWRHTRKKALAKLKANGVDLESDE